MRIVFATEHLAGLGGSETYLLTVAEQLERMGHEVVVWAIEQGRSSEIARERGLVVAAPDATNLPQECDALITQDAPTAYALADRYPGTPQLYVLHSRAFDLSVPPQIPGVVSVLVALSGSTERWARSLAHAPEIVRLRQPLDLTRFTPSTAPPSEPRVLLSLGNYLHGSQLDALAQACEIRGIELRLAGSLSAVEERPEVAMAQADIVAGKARVIIEAMACGRPAFLYDQIGCGGWVTTDNYAVLEDDAFAGRPTPIVSGPAELAAELGKYDPSLGAAGRELAYAHHSVLDHCSSLGEVLVRLAPSPAPPEPVAEFGRMARIVWRLERRVMDAEWAANAYARERDQARTDADLANRRADDAHADARLAHRRADEAHAAIAMGEKQHDAVLQRAKDAEAWITALKATRRWRLLQRLTRPLDRLRRR